MADWVKEHGYTVPDHPVLFVETGTLEAQVFPDAEAFLVRHGDMKVLAMPEYSQSGSHFKDYSIQGKVYKTFLEHEETWNDTFLYYSDFECKTGSLCQESALEFGIPLLFRAHSFKSKNFLVGGPYSGLPFHKHGMTWQGLSMGRKAWYLLPPGTMSEAMHDLTGPYVFPVRSWHSIMQDKPLGERPLYCEQHAGETLFLPDYWWHATMNLDRYQVAYGEKPMGLHQQANSTTAGKILRTLPEQLWDSAGYSSHPAGGTSWKERPMPFSIKARKDLTTLSCLTELDNSSTSLEEPMRRMRLDSSAQMRCGLAETAAFAHCNCAAFLLEVAGKCHPSNATFQAAYKRAATWRRAAAALSPSLFHREPLLCGTQEQAAA